MAIMSDDVVTKQKDIVLGCLPENHTADIEADETSFRHWSDGYHHYWYPWIENRFNFSDSNGNGSNSNDYCIVSPSFR